MMFGEQHLAHPVEILGEFLEFLGQQILLEQLFLQPHRNGGLERGKAPGRERHIGFEQALELQERLVVEDDEVDVVQAAAGLGQAILDGQPGKTRVVFLAGEAFFLGGGNDAAILDQRGGTVMIERR